MPEQITKQICEVGESSDEIGCAIVFRVVRLFLNSIGMSTSIVKLLRTHLNSPTTSPVFCAAVECLDIVFSAFKTEPDSIKAETFLLLESILNRLINLYNAGDEAGFVHLSSVVIKCPDTTVSCEIGKLFLEILLPSMQMYLGGTNQEKDVNFELSQKDSDANATEVRLSPKLFLIQYSIPLLNQTVQFIINHPTISEEHSVLGLLSPSSFLCFLQLLASSYTSVLNSFESPSTEYEESSLQTSVFDEESKKPSSSDFAEEKPKTKTTEQETAQSEMKETSEISKKTIDEDNDASLQKASEVALQKEVDEGDQLVNVLTGLDVPSKQQQPTVLASTETPSPFAGSINELISQHTAKSLKTDGSLFQNLSSALSTSSEAQIAEKVISTDKQLTKDNIQIGLASILQLVISLCETFPELLDTS
eukprot:MONOS_4511.1-p1 / transcript=MONOS_4511.1 / gene=MONOS_4511 / organism=Monocercomonoides_exilis_PA203 / gene_product=unspecified product / transcript_product=unspecified product / location=Mono_scaffold00121:14198-15460(+) / protein_length=421 / sequence_SO=supercontig / SO=protein_coding / is_pseudo=false